MRSNWTPERDAIAKRMRGEGYSSSEIAAALGGITRNAVIGRMARCAVPTGPLKPGGRPLSRGAPSRRAMAKQREAKIARRIQAPVRPQEAAVEAMPGPAAVTLLELRPEHCRFPYGDPREPAFRYCGLPRADIDNPLKMYCAGHWLITHEQAR